MKFFSRRRVLAALGILIVLILAFIGGVIAYLNSQAFDARVRRYIVEEIERQTGAKVVLNGFNWDFWHQRIRLEDLILRGLEPAEDAPLAHIHRIDVGLNFRTLFQHRIDLFELTITQPEFHILVRPDGKTNFPTPPSQTGRAPFDFEISIRNFNLVDGSGLINHRPINIDLSLTNLTALLNYQAGREVLEAHLRYDGVLDRAPDVRLPIPYTVSAEVDYTRDTIVAHRIALTSSSNEVKLQGRINQVLGGNISGKLEYTGNAQLSFLNYFFTEESFAGKAAMAGSLEFTPGHFLTRGKTTSDAIDFEGWHATRISTDYLYQYPQRRLELHNLKNNILGGASTGAVTVENLPGPSKVILDLAYSNIDAAEFARAYPWDRKYRIYSKATGTMKGWFEGKLARFDLAGHADLTSYAPPARPDIVPFPLDGSTDYELRPGQAKVANGDVRFFSTTVRATGLIHPRTSDLKIEAASANLKDLSFLYAEANGSGTFAGSVSGQIAKPILNGEFTLENHSYRNWKIQQAAGGVQLDLETQNATLRNVRVTQGESQILVSGTTHLSGTPLDLRVQSTRLRAEDVRPFLKRDVEGVFAGDVHVTGLAPNLRLEGDVRADNLYVDRRLIGNARGHILYSEPLIDIEQLSVQQNGSTLTGNLLFNPATDALKFTARVNAVNLQMFYPLGLPDAVQGIIRQADLRGDGTTQIPNVRGTATLQNLSVGGEVFPQARVDLSSTNTKLDVQLDAGRNLNLSAQIDTAAPNYPFTAKANFTEYPVEHIAQLTEGTISATGTANLSGLLTDQTRLRGNGRIETADIRIRQINLKPTKPFTFDFNPDTLTLSGVTLTGQATQVDLEGTIGLRERAPLNLRVNGQINLGLIPLAYPDVVTEGTLDARVTIGGTVRTPDLQGTATLAGASLKRQGFFTSVTKLNGTLNFDQDRIYLNGIEGNVGGGTLRAQGSAVLQSGAVQNMTIEIDADNVRMRGYPEGLRAVVNGRLTLRGALSNPLLEGNIQIQSLAYRASFEEFLALLTEENLGKGSSLFGTLRLSLHVEGGKNITIQNQLADVEARVDIDWKGTFDDPAITGHVEASGGTLSFQGNRYTVTRGNIDFVDPQGIRPVIDIEAESQVRDYRVILSVTGRGDNPKLALRSDPPLPELEIVSLIAGGRTRDEIASRSTNNLPSSERLFQSGAASILFDLLQQRVGNRLGVLGGGRVRIDPFLVGAENNPGARITLSEQVTKDLSITYSQDLSSNRQMVVLIEYFVGRNTSILASRDELGNFGLDLRHRTRIK